jgi:hypothetical protein
MVGSLALGDHFGRQPEVNPSKIGVIGISYGGLRGLLHSLIDKRVKGAVLLVAGASISDILAYSSWSRISRIREHHMKTAGITDREEYRRLLEDLLPLHAEDVASLRKPEDFLLYVSNVDAWVPTFSQWRVWEILGEPAYEAYNVGHIRTPTIVSFTKGAAMHKFFRGRWGEPQDDRGEAPNEDDVAALERYLQLQPHS